jgi:formylglycine-generating enzyme required for sulfatase activity
MEFVLMPAGTFTMGSPASDPNAYDDEKPAHQVTISKPFYMGKYEVTQAQWKAVMGSENNPSYFKGDSLPVDHVSWRDVQEFIQKLNRREEQASGVFCRLPTEAEWEYAARAGTTTLYSFGDDAAELDDYAWYAGNADHTSYPVGQKKPNAWGLYDMHGNVSEWCQDW